jgi:hypothetical protein
MVFEVAYGIFILTSLTAGWSIADSRSRLLIGGAATAAIASYAAYVWAGAAIAPTLVTMIDCALLALSIWVATTSDRFWPLWFAGFQGAAVLTKVAASWAAMHDQWLFTILASFWVIPCMGSMLIGLMQDRRWAAARAA